MRIVTAVLVCLAGLAGIAQPRVADFPPTLILISFDGWRWDYHETFDVPNARRVMARGVGAGNLVPGFPSKTFPNQYSIVTGLYPGHHGIVANTSRDPPTGRLCSLSNRREVGDPMWWGGGPLWIRVQDGGRPA